MPSVVVLGASADRSKFGNKAVRAFLQRGYQVYPVNPRETVIEGLEVYPSLESVPGRPEEVTVYVPPGVLMPLLPAMAARGCEVLWLTPGTDTPEVLAVAARLGLPVRAACSIVALGWSPADL